MWFKCIYIACGMFVQSSSISPRATIGFSYHVNFHIMCFGGGMTLDSDLQGEWNLLGTSPYLRNPSPNFAPQSSQVKSPPRLKDSRDVSSCGFQSEVMIVKVCSEDSGWQEAERGQLISRDFLWLPQWLWSWMSRGPDRHWLNSSDLCSVQTQLRASVRQWYWSQEWSIDHDVHFSFFTPSTEMLAFLFVQVITFILSKKLLNGHDWQFGIKRHMNEKDQINQIFISCGKLPHQSARKMDLVFSDVSQRKNIVFCLLCVWTLCLYMFFRENLLRMHTWSCQTSLKMNLSSKI